jgi:hypothetical protein
LVAVPEQDLSRNACQSSHVTAYTQQVQLVLGKHPHSTCNAQLDAYLQHVQRDATANDSTHKRDNQGDKVDRQLELQELPDAVEHTPAPQHSPAAGTGSAAAISWVGHQPLSAQHLFADTSVLSKVIKSLHAINAVKQHTIPSQQQEEHCTQFVYWAPT